jgi:hypothetical protein
VLKVELTFIFQMPETYNVQQRYDNIGFEKTSTGRVTKRNKNDDYTTQL